MTEIESFGSISSLDRDSISFLLFASSSSSSSATFESSRVESSAELCLSSAKPLHLCWWAAISSFLTKRKKKRKISPWESIKNIAIIKRPVRIIPRQHLMHNCRSSVLKKRFNLTTAVAIKRERERAWCQGFFFKRKNKKRTSRPTTSLVVSFLIALINKKKKRRMPFAAPS